MIVALCLYRSDKNKVAHLWNATRTHTNTLTSSVGYCMKVPSLWVPPEKLCIISFVSDFLYSRVTLRHVKKEDSCSQISPLKNYIKRANCLAVRRMTTAKGWGGGTVGGQLWWFTKRLFFVLGDSFNLDTLQQQWQWRLKRTVMGRGNGKSFFISAP